MNDIWTKWADTTGTRDKWFAGLLIAWSLIELLTLALNPSWARAGGTLTWIALTGAFIAGDYYYCLWRKFEPLTDFGAAIGDHLHAYGDLLIKKNGHTYKITPLTHGSRDD